MINSWLATLQNSATFKAGLYAKVDGKDIPYLYVYDNGTYFMDKCPGGELCGEDSCDAEPIVSCDKWDAYPMFGWYALDTQNSRNGDKHTYEFGGKTECIVVKYTITAKGDDDSDTCDRFGFDFVRSLGSVASSFPKDKGPPRPVHGMPVV
jgi:hypothetical protein